MTLFTRAQSVKFTRDEEDDDDDIVMTHKLVTTFNLCHAE